MEQKAGRKKQRGVKGEKKVEGRHERTKKNVKNVKLAPIEEEKFENGLRRNQTRLLDNDHIITKHIMKVSCHEIVGVDVGQGREQEGQRLMTTHTLLFENDWCQGYFMITYVT
jgi:hypothetical protein